jgi:hypothetical protein
MFPIWSTSFKHLYLLLSCCPFNKQIEQRNYEDDVIEPNISKDSGKGVFIEQHCFMFVEYCFLCVYNLVYLLFTYLLHKKLNCVTLWVSSLTLLLRRIVE